MRVVAGDAAQELVGRAAGSLLPERRQFLRLVELVVARSPPRQVHISGRLTRSGRSAAIAAVDQVAGLGDVVRLVGPGVHLHDGDTGHRASSLSRLGAGLTRSDVPPRAIPLLDRVGERISRAPTCGLARSRSWIVLGSGFTRSDLRPRAILLLDRVGERFTRSDLRPRAILLLDRVGERIHALRPAASRDPAPGSCCGADSRALTFRLARSCSITAASRGGARCGSGAAAEPERTDQRDEADRFRPSDEWAAGSAGDE